jgi:hypothetical protein
LKEGRGPTARAPLPSSLFPLLIVYYLLPTTYYLLPSFTYRSTGRYQMNIGQAVEVLKQGHRVCRSGWNGKGMWLILIPAEAWHVEDISDERIQLMGMKDNRISNSSWVAMKTADNKVVPWLCSQTDLLAADWEIVTND